MEQMVRLVSYLVGFQKGYFASRPHVQKPFLMAVESNLILYGHDGKKFFDEGFEEPEEFDARWEKLAARLPTPGFYHG